MRLDTPTAPVDPPPTALAVTSQTAPAVDDIWVASVDAGTCPAEDRARFAEAAGRLAGPPRSALLVTCHRAELYGVGPLPDLSQLAEAALGRIRLLRGAAAVLHVFRLAAGLESTVVGEDQVLHQVRELRQEARRRGRLDPRLSRLLETASNVGRRARAARSSSGLSASRPDGGAGAGLAGPAFDWLAEAGVVLGGSDVLIVGAGEMGRLLVHEGRRRGARVIVASRDRRRAAAAVGGSRLALDLDGAGQLAAAGRVAGIAVALRGRWTGLEEVRPKQLPPLVDLSAPPAVPGGLASAQVDIDGLFRLEADTATRLDPAGGTGDYAASAEAIVEAALGDYARWAGGRPSVRTLQLLRASAETRRTEALDRLLRRLPDLPPRERALLEEFSEQLVAGILHAPSARLREDADGRAATATRDLFDL